LVTKTFDISINPIRNTTSYITQYIGNIRIDNIVLPTTQGYVYDFQLSYKLDLFNIDVTSSNSYVDSIRNTAVGFVSNITANSTSNKIGSNIKIPIPNIPSSLNYAIIKNPSNGFSFSGN
jgi:hypothetical protein